MLEAVVQRCSVKKGVLENTCTRMRVSGTGVFLCILLKFVITPFFTEHFRWLLLFTLPYLHLLAYIFTLIYT